MPSFDLIDTALMGNLQSRLDEWRDQGLSHEAIARNLAQDGFVVSRETVRRWLLRAEDAKAS